LIKREGLCGHDQLRISSHCTYCFSWCEPLNCAPLLKHGISSATPSLGQNRKISYKNIWSTQNGAIGSVNRRGVKKSSVVHAAYTRSLSARPNCKRGSSAGDQNLSHLYVFTNNTKSIPKFLFNTSEQKVLSLVFIVWWCFIKKLLQQKNIWSYDTSEK
jgi:hypothetical protein